MKKWRQWNLYYYGDMDRFINQCVGTIIKKCNEIENIEWFFIRYWESGPHIRLRIKCSYSDIINEIVQKEVCKEKYNISSQIDKDAIYKQQIYFAQREKINITPAIYDNQTVIRMKYVPENNKYGYDDILLISEYIFKLSSEICLELLRTEGYKEKKYVYCIICFLVYFSFIDKLNPFNLCEQYGRIWAAYLDKNIVDIEKKLKGSINIEASKSRALVRDWKKIIEDSILGKWKYELEAKIKEQKVLIEYNMKNNYEFLAMVFNYIHVHNNRLGIVPAEEIYLSLIIKNAYGIEEEMNERDYN